MITLTTFDELVKALTDNNDLFGAITFSDKTWKAKEGGWSLPERTYIFSGHNKAFGNYAGYSCFASDIAELEFGVRLEQYWDRWERLACYIMDEDSIDKFKDMINGMET